MTCHNCSAICKKFGKFGPKRIQRYRCNQCKKTFSEAQDKPLDDMRISLDKAEMCLKLLLEGMSIRSVQRITGLHQETILNLITLAGERCEKLMRERIKGIAVKDVEADEIWGFVGCKNRHKLNKGVTDPHRGDGLYVCRNRTQHKAGSGVALGRARNGRYRGLHREAKRSY